jgi:hypothetical protein
MLRNVWAVADGLKLYLEQAGDVVIQNIFYNGWQHDHYVSNVLVFAPNGCIYICAINAPGAMHYSQIADWGNVYSKLGRVFERHGARCLVDSAFCQVQHPFLLKSSQEDSASSDAHHHLVSAQATSARQAAEWGMRAFQSSFPRIKDRLIYEEGGERVCILKSMILLYNFRARQVGINQIANTYMPHLGHDANIFLNVN